MIFLGLALQSLRNRAFSTGLAVLSIGLCVALLLSVERAKRAAQEGFAQSISQTDLIVGARSGQVQLILYTVFNMGSTTNDISYETYEEFKKHPSVEWTIPYSLGDSHKGFRVVGTNEDFFKHYHFRGEGSVEIAQGKVFEGLWDVVVGSEVAKKLNYALGQKIVLAHGVTHGEGIQMHSDKPFEIVGIMKPTGTPLDRAVYISLPGLEAIHIDWQNGAAPSSNKMISVDQIKVTDIKVKTVTAFFVQTKTRIETLRLQREINNYKKEPLLAIIPGVTLSELWNSLSYIEQVLKIISWMVLAVGFMAMLIALTTTLNERRREMAILRSIGASGKQIMMILVFESTLLTLGGIVLGVLLSSILILLMTPWLARKFGLYVTGSLFTNVEIAYMILTLVGGVLIGFVPASRALKSALKDGLSVQL